MGFAIAVVFISLSYLSPPDTFPFIAGYRPMQILALLGILSTIITILSGRYSWWVPQLFLMALFTGILIVSQPLHGWLGGGIEALQSFLPATVLFYVVALNTVGERRVKILAITLILISVYFGWKGIRAVNYGEEQQIYTAAQRIDNPNDGTSTILLRARGVGFLGDPNDLAQNHVVSLALLGLFWKKRNFFRNFLLVLVPGSYLLYVTYLTGSRGGLVGLFVLFAFALQRRLGSILGPAFSGGMMAILLFVFGFGGGRALGISSSGSSGRLDTWSEQLPLLFSNPILGVGWNAIRSYTKHTSHNSFLLCAVELGIPGYFIWMALVMSTIYYLNHVLDQATKPEHEALRRTAFVVRLALFTFLTTSWFLSRTYVSSMYVMLAMSLGVYYWALHQGALTEARPRKNWLKATALAVIFTLGSIYGQVRIRWMS